MKNIYFSAPITHETSYGICGLNFTEQLNKNEEINLSIGPISRTATYDPAAPEQNLSHLHNKDLDGEITSIVLFHAGAINQYHHPNAAKRIGWPIFELNGFNETELDDLSKQDEIIVCTQWAKAIVGQYFPNKPIHVVPLGYNPKFYQFFEKHPNQYEHNTIILNIGKWEHRKCHTELANIFRAAFSPFDNVKLLMCPTNFFIGETANKKIKSDYKNILGNQVFFYDRLNSQREIANIQNLADISLQISRSEGWGLPAFEGLVLGKNVIATTWGGYSEYIDKFNSYTVPITQLEPANDGFWFNGQFQWGHFGQDQFDITVNHLRNIHRKVQTEGHKNNPAVHDSVSHFTWAYACRKLVEVLHG